MARAVPNDLVVLCSDDISAVYRRVMAESRTQVGGAAIGAPGEFAVDEG
jgi:hypothetical protein